MVLQRVGNLVGPGILGLCVAATASDCAADYSPRPLAINHGSLGSEMTTVGDDNGGLVQHLSFVFQTRSISTGVASRSGLLGRLKASL